MNVAQETLGFRRAGLSPALSLLMSAFALPIPPAALSSHLHRPTERSRTASAVSYRLSAFSTSLVDTLNQSLQHPGDRRVLVLPSANDVVFDVSKVLTVARPKLHLVA